MHHQTSNINITEQIPLAPPHELIKQFPLSEKDNEQIYIHRREIEAIMSRKDKRFMLIVGPCSIHHVEEAFQYAEKLRALKERVQDRIMIVMRVYFEKPRTVVGWKGLIYDPELNGTYNIGKGITLARKLMLDILELGLPIGTEILDPIITQYLADLISWAAIGARTTESQTHRQLVSGLSMPTGFKNTTDGSIKVAVEAAQAASHKHSFIGVLEDGQIGVFRTNGNPHTHVVLRGGINGPNYGSEHIAFTRELMRKNDITPNIIVDCSHANSAKKPELQQEVLSDIIQQRLNGEDSLIGAMVESNLKTGSQKVEAIDALEKGLSITDPCIGWEETEKLVMETYDALH